MRNKLVSNASRKDCNPYTLVCLRKDSCTSYCVASFNMDWQNISILSQSAVVRNKIY